MDLVESPALPPGKALPDYLVPGLKLVIIGINPGYYSAQVGHYYARPEFILVGALSSGLVPTVFGPENDADLLKHRIGLTDVVKRPTHSSGELARRIRSGR